MENARKQLDAAANWLFANDDELSAGLLDAIDGLRLYAYAKANPNLPEMADKWSPQERINAIGYDPLKKSELLTVNGVTPEAVKALVAAQSSWIQGISPDRRAPPRTLSRRM